MDRGFTFFASFSLSLFVFPFGSIFIFYPFLFFSFFLVHFYFVWRFEWEVGWKCNWSGINVGFFFSSLLIKRKKKSITSFFSVLENT